MAGQGKNRRLRPVCVNLNILFILAPLVFKLCYMFNLLHPLVRVYLNFSFLNLNVKFEMYEVRPKWNERSMRVLQVLPLPPIVSSQNMHKYWRLCINDVIKSKIQNHSTLVWIPLQLMMSFLNTEQPLGLKYQN